MLPIIDTHQHLWDLSIFNLPWTRSSPQLNRSFVPRDYREATSGQNVVKSVYMEVDVSPDQQVKEAEYIIDLCAQSDTPTVAAVISGRPASDEFRAYVDRFKDHSAIKGLRQVLHGDGTPPGYCVQDSFVDGIRYLGECGLSFDLCVRPAELADAARLVDLCPDTQFILDHCGNADPNIVNGRVQPEAATSGESYRHTAEQWRDGISNLAERPNVVCKISGIVARVKWGNWEPADLAPTVNHCLDAFGPDRVIFGGDWPVCTMGASYSEWASALREIIRPRNQEEQRKLLHDNAERLYGLA